ncbi:MAG: hypothetical protein ACR2MQ_13730 [Gemmatimonadaceae bacterium]
MKRGNTPTALSAIKGAVPPSEYDHVVGWINFKPKVRRVLFPALFGAEVYQLQRYLAPEPTDLARELAWASAVLVPHVQKIRKFVAGQQSFLRSLLRGDFDQVTASLEMIKKAVGDSLWGTFSEVAALQLNAGLEAQKVFVKVIRDRAPAQNVAAFLVHQVSERNEPTVALSSFRANVNAALAASGPATTSLPAVLRYYMLGQLPDTSTDLARLLAAGTNGSGCGYYGLLLDVCRAVAALRLPEAAPARDALERLSGIGDCRAGYVGFALTAEQQTNSPGKATQLSVRTQSTPEQQQACTVYDSLLRDDATARELVKEAYALSPDAPEWLELSMRCSNGVGSGASLLQAVPARLRVLATRVGDTHAAVDWLAKLALNIRGLPWATAIDAYVAASAWRHPEPVPSAETMYFLANLPPTIPWFHKFAPAPVAGSYRVAPDQAARCLVGMQLLESLGDANQTVEPCLEDVSALEQELAAAQFAYRRENYSDAAEIAHRCIAVLDPLCEARAVQLAAWSLLRAGKFSESVGLITDALLRNEHLAEVCPLRELAAAIPMGQRVLLASSVTLGVFYDFVASAFGIAYDAHRKDAFEDYLASRGVKRPSQLPDDADGTNTAQFVYYLRYLCVPAILQTSTGGYRNDSELSEERLVICSRLIRLDPANTGVYEDEIKSIIRETTIGKRVRELDQSRVYVDVGGVRAAAITRVAEPYRRYVEFVRHGLAVASDVSEEELAAAIRAIRQGESSPLDLLSLPSNEAANLLTAILAEIADLYFLSPAHGLERYLSTRIRHGVLEGTLRTPLAEANIVTPLVRATNSYEPNAHWLTVLGLADTVFGEKARGYFAAFSREFDDLTRRIRTDWVRAARTGGSHDALFRYEITPTSVRIIAAEFTPPVALDLFVDIVLAGMRISLDEMLPRVRQAIAEQAKGEATRLLVTLQEDIHGVCDAAGTGSAPFDHAITTARTAVQRAFDHVAAWFQPSPSTLTEPFTLELAVDVAVRSVQAVYPDFLAETKTFGMPAEWTGRYSTFLPSVVDVLFPALQNAGAHGERGTATATVELHHALDSTRVVIGNHLRPGEDVVALTWRLDRIRDEQVRGSHISAVAGEGGTGLHKLYSNLETMFENPGLEFGVSDTGDMFFVEFTLPVPTDLE